MSTQTEPLSTLPDILYQGHRELRDLGNHQPGVRFQKKAMRALGLLDEDGVDTDHEAVVAVYGDGRVVVDLQTDS